jgi:hypothetical protein
MPNKVAMTLAVVSFFTTSGYAFAEHEVEFSFPWEQTQSLRGHKLEGKKTEHWGKHHGLPRNSYRLYPGHRPSLTYGCGENGPVLPPCPHGQVYGFADGWMYH